MTSFLYWGGRQNTLLTTFPPLAWHCRYPLLLPSALLLSLLQIAMFGVGGRESDIIYDLCRPYLVPIQSPQTKITRRTGWSWLMSAECCGIRRATSHQTSSLLSPALSLAHWNCHCHKLELTSVTSGKKVSLW